MKRKRKRKEITPKERANSWTAIYEIL